MAIAQASRHHAQHVGWLGLHTFPWVPNRAWRGLIRRLQRDYYEKVPLNIELFAFYVLALSSERQAQRDPFGGICDDLSRGVLAYRVPKPVLSQLRHVTTP